jgi:hypothetical protein
MNNADSHSASHPLPGKSQGRHRSPHDLINDRRQASINAIGVVRPAHQPTVTAVRAPARPRQQRGVLLTTHPSRHGPTVHPGGHPPALRAAVTATLTRIEADLERHGWDQPPALIGIFRHPSPHDLTRTTTQPIRSTVELRIEVDGGLVGPDTWHRPTRPHRRRTCTRSTCCSGCLTSSPWRACGTGCTAAADD